MTTTAAERSTATTGQNDVMRRPGSFHAIAWVAWAIGAALCMEMAPSPLYVGLVIAVCVLVVGAHGLGTMPAKAFPWLLGIGVVFAVVRIVLAVLTTHGGDGVVMTAPALTLPRLLGGFAVGGTVEWPVLLRAAIDSFLVVGLMAVFGAFNAVVAHDELVHAAPRAFYEVGLVMTVGVAFVPATIATVGRVRDADRARCGGAPRRRGRLVRLAVPLLENGMEQAVTLAESMDARGFAGTGATAGDHAAGWLTMGAMAGFIGAFVALVDRAPGVALVLAFSAVAALGGAVVVASRRAPRPRYRPRPVRSVDRAVIAASVAAPVLVALAALLGDESLVWRTNGTFQAPQFDVLVAAAILLLAAPALSLSPRSGLA